MKRPQSISILTLFILMILVLSACSNALAGQPAVSTPTVSNQPVQKAVESTDSTSVETQQPKEGSSDSPSAWTYGEPQLDEQGAVVVEIKPLNLGNPGETLDFEVSMNTHSVDLSMDLAALATLTTDTGKIVSATGWDAPLSGHHVSGTLSFPATLDGTPVLDEAEKLTLTLVNVDVPQRVFQWNR